MTKVYNLNISCAETLPSPYELLQELPVTLSQADFIEKCRAQTKAILEGTDARRLLIVGPCSIHNIAAAKEYAVKLKHLAEEVVGEFFVVMRVYVEKPRTGIGWKGLLYDPLLDGSDRIAMGIHWARELMLELAYMGVPVATEFLDPVTPQYFGDLVSWGCIGARTVSSQIHRQVASGLTFPIGFKNNTDGNVGVAVKGVMAARQPQSFIGVDAMGRCALTHTRGNPHAHIVLRGGDTTTNYDPQSIERACILLEEEELKPALIVDCSHGNSKRIAEQQIFVFQSLLNQIVEGNMAIRGLQIESNLKGGQQPHTADPKQLDYAVSLTDPCLDWETTQRLIRLGAKKLRQNRCVPCEYSL